MAKSTRRPQQIYTVVMWLLSLVFAAFLVGLGGLVIKDLPRADKTITVEQFIDQDQARAIADNITVNDGERSQTQREIEDAIGLLNARREAYNSGLASLNNWLATRTATQAQDQNPEVINRTRAVEALKAQEREAEVALSALQTQLRTIEREGDSFKSARNALTQAARPEYRKAKNAQALRVFLYRLALTLPLLIAAGWMAAKKRRSAYWPLYRGFILFALFAFFIELVPYLPSYGGYVRYGVGIAVVLIFGHFIIRSMRRYLERKQMEESRSEGERRQSIEYETALKKIAAKTCPGCDRSIIEREDVVTDFCVHCGIRLKEKCGSCGERNISFHRFCLCCGEKTHSGLIDDANDSAQPKLA